MLNVKYVIEKCSVCDSLNKDKVIIHDVCYKPFELNTQAHHNILHEGI